jgi:LuxR family maltose regulon positive regulatory protein
VTEAATRLPRLAKRLVARPSLIKRLDRMAAVTVLDGLAGSGKTTLLGQWARHLVDSGVDVVWVDPGRPDSEPRELVPGLRHAVGSAMAEIDRELVIVIDGLERLDDVDGEAVAALLDALSANDHLHLAISTPSSQSVSRAVLGRGLQLNVLSSGDLAASPQQLPAFAEAWGHDLTPERAEQLHAETGGWLVPTQLALDATPQDASGFRVGSAERFIQEQVVPHAERAPHEVEIAVGLATSPVVTHALAERVITALGHGGTAGAVDVIDQFAAHGLLTPVPGRGPTPTWRFPHVVGRALHALPSSTAVGSARLAVHRALARTLAQLSSEEPAQLAATLDHARKGEDWGLLGELWRKYGLSLLGRHPKEAAYAYGDLPFEVMEQSPSMRIAAAVVAEDMSPEGDEAERVVRRYARVGRTFSTATLDESQPDEVVSVVTATMVARRMQGRMAEALDVAGWYGDRTPGPGPRRSGVSEGPQAWFEMQWGMTHLLAGNLAEAIALSTGAFDVAYGDEALGFVSTYAASHLSLSHALLGSLPEAERWLEPRSSSGVLDGWVGELARLPAQISAAIIATDHLDEAKAHGYLETISAFPPMMEMWPFMALASARYAVLFGDPSDTMLQIYDARARRRSLVGDSDASRLMVDRCLVDLMVAAGELTRAQALLTKAGHGSGAFKVAEARLNLSAGRYERGRQIAETGARVPSTTVRDRIDLLMVQAVCALRQDHDDEARLAFGLAHAIVERVGMTSAYAYVERDDLERLLALAAVELPAEVGEALGRVRSPMHHAAELVLLTPRELEVVRQMALSASVADVAAALNVSVNTVKKQRVSLYAKLGVNDPHSAVMRAQRLGLFEPLQ